VRQHGIFKEDFSMKQNILIIGAGGVAHVAAHKLARQSHDFAQIHLASRSLHKA